MLVPGASHSSLPVSSDTLPLAPPAFSAPPPETVSQQPEPDGAAAAIISHSTLPWHQGCAQQGLSILSPQHPCGLQGPFHISPKPGLLPPEATDRCHRQPHSPTLLRPDLSLPSSGLDERVVEFFHSAGQCCTAGSLSSLPCDLLRSCLSS